MPRKRKFPLPRFSLRLAAIVLTVGCVWLGLFARSARRQETAVAELASLGATVDYDCRVEDLWAPAWLRDLMGDDYFRSVVYVQLRYRTENKRRQSLTPAEWDAAIAAIQNLPRVNRIHFGYTGVSDDDLARFAPLAGQIEELYFNEGWESKLTGDGLQRLAAWPRLRSLGVPFGMEDSDGLNRLQKFPALTSLCWHEINMDDSDFDALANCRNLEQLTLRGCSFLGASFSRLRNAPALKSVSLHNTRPVHFARHWTEPANIMPIDDDANNIFEFIPESDQPWDANAPRFPDEQYREWLKEVLPEVAVTEMSTS